MSATFDAVSLQVLWRRMVSAVDEASIALVRVAFSTVVRESHDFACVITDERGRLLAQATASIPSFIGTLPRTVGHFIDTFGRENLHPGDVLICNDPWQGTGEAAASSALRRPPRTLRTSAGAAAAWRSATCSRRDSRFRRSS
jgi:N-methylhydantoinase B